MTGVGVEWNTFCGAETHSSSGSSSDLTGVVVAASTTSDTLLVVWTWLEAFSTGINSWSSGSSWHSTALWNAVHVTLKFSSAEGWKSTLGLTSSWIEVNTSSIWNTSSHTALNDLTGSSWTSSGVTVWIWTVSSTRSITRRWASWRRWSNTSNSVTITVVVIITAA